jgi:hypothetical protein
MNIIDKYVDSLQTNKLNAMNKDLIELGERHYIYRAKKNYFIVSKQSTVSSHSVLIIAILHNRNVEF